MSENPTLQDLLERDKDVIGGLKRQGETSKIEPEWVMLAELGLYFGWEAIRDARANQITIEEMHKLIVAGRKLKALERYNGVMDTYSAFMGTQSKKGASSLKDTLRNLRKQWQ